MIVEDVGGDDVGNDETEMQEEKAVDGISSTTSSNDVVLVVHSRATLITGTSARMALPRPTTTTTSGTTTTTTRATAETTPATTDVGR